MKDILIAVAGSVASVIALVLLGQVWAAVIVGCIQLVFIGTMAYVEHANRVLSKMAKATADASLMTEIS